MELLLSLVDISYVHFSFRRIDLFMSDGHAVAVARAVLAVVFVMLVADMVILKR